MFKWHGKLVWLKSVPENSVDFSAALLYGPQQPCHNHIKFLEKEFADMILKDQWKVYLLLL